MQEQGCLDEYFFEHLKRLLRFWKENEDAFGLGVGAL